MTQRIHAWYCGDGTAPQERSREDLGDGRCFLVPMTGAARDPTVTPASRCRGPQGDEASL